jgi:hypothetical protein
MARGCAAVLHEIAKKGASLVMLPHGLPSLPPTGLLQLLCDACDNVLR